MYRPVKKNIADALSQLNSGEEYDFVRAIVESCMPVALSLKEIEKASHNDEELCVAKTV